MNYVVDLVEARSTSLAAVRQRTTFAALSNTIVESLNAVYAFLQGQPQQTRGHNVVVYLDRAPTVEVGVQVSAPFPPAGSILCTSTPSGMTAHTVHRGPYPLLHEAHAAVQDWCREHGKLLAGVSWEVYGDWTEDEAQLLTDVHYLLESREDVR